MGLKTLFDSCSDNVMVDSCEIHWSKKEVGFGSFYFHYNEDGKLICTSECMGPKFVREILNSMVDAAIFEDIGDGTLTGKELTPEKWDALPNNSEG